jgi:glycosyltransferase involved in cell wall biosynthesis/beta-glucosidase/6-phospho-beta-glucosidase/beta-galactosidase
MSAAGEVTMTLHDEHHPLHPLPPVGRTFVAGFESTYHPHAGVDALDTTGHSVHRDQDLADMAAGGVRHLRYPLRWQRIQPSPGVFDWDETDRVLGALNELGAVPIVDLVHHTSYPDWLSDGFRGPDFGPAFVEYAEAVASRYPWLGAYTLFNEPFATLFLAGHEGLWPPYDRGVAGLRRLLRSVLPALSEAAAVWRRLLPAAHHVWVDTAEHHTGTGPAQEYAALANDRRHSVLDLALGHDLDPARPFLSALLADDGDALLQVPPLRVDVLGLDYYCHSEWFYDEDGSHSPSPQPIGLAAVAEHYWTRYALPLMLTETNIRGLPSDRTSWLRYTLEQYELALSRGVPLHGYCWFPQVDSADWDSLLARCAGRADPVGVHSLRPDGTRARTSFTDAWEAAARGMPVADLPAVRFQPPCDAQLAGVLPSLGHWPWRDPSPAEAVPALRADLPRPAAQAAPHAATDTSTDTLTDPSTDSAADTATHPLEATMPSSTPGATGPTEPDLVVLSHLRWPWVWQRPQHIVSRLAQERAAHGARTWFVEEPVVEDVDSPRLGTQEVDGLTRVWLIMPSRTSPDVPRPNHPLDRGFEDPAARDYGAVLARAMEDAGRPARPDVWLYTPMALDTAQALDPGCLIYDVMDDLASFKDAPEGLVLRQRRLLTEADVVFTGGPSLHRGIQKQRTEGVHLFRSGVETDHYAASRRLRAVHDRPVAGYVGVVDERLDLDLIGRLAAELPDWTVRIVGPVAKIDPADLPQAPNLEYPGMASYDELPAVMAGFDVALMPFALNEATRNISPTKTLEYLAAGLPVVSTRVRDVVDDYSDVVHLADDGADFAAACRKVAQDDCGARDRRVRPLQARQEWDHIASSMAALIDEARAAAAAGSGSAQEETA